MTNIIDLNAELGTNIKLKQFLGFEDDYKYDEHQKKLIQNVKHCADSQWMWVNSYYDGDTEESWEFFENAENVYDIIYDESSEVIFRPGYQHFGSDAKEYLNDTKFAGKDFKEKVVFYYTVKLYEEAIPEIEFSKEQQQKVLNVLQKIKSNFN